MTIALLDTEIFTPVTLIVRVSDRRDFILQGALSCGNAIDQNGRFCPCRQRYHQDLSFPFVSSFRRGQIHQWDSSQANTIGGTRSVDHFACVLVRQSATMQLVSIHLTMSGWSDPISSRNSP